MKPLQVYLDNIGCRLNWSEIERWARQFAAAGYAIVSEPEQADVIAVNTCAVTDQAERKTRHQVRSLHRDNPNARIAVIGCYATLRPETCAEFPNVDWVVPNAEKEETTAKIDEAEGKKQKTTNACPRSSVTLPLRTRAFVKVQDGCDHHCTYCIVRSLRGSSHSRAIDDIVAEAQMLVEEADCKEIVLTGASLGSYGRDRSSESDLRTLVEALLAHTDIARLRLSSLEPWDIDEAFLELWEDPRLCRQLHLPLQAGCNETLRRMGRPITKEEFARLVEGARTTITDLAVTTDVLVGFPGEDEAAFQESYDFVERVAFAKLHVFPYSARPGTPATKLPDPVPRQARDERAQRMRKLGKEQRQRFRERLLGRELEVLWEKQRRDGRWTGWTGNYLRVVARAEDPLYNQITRTHLLTVEKGHLKGEVVE